MKQQLHRGILEYTALHCMYVYMYFAPSKVLVLCLSFEYLIFFN